MDQLVGIFPTPFMVCRQLIPAALIQALIAQFEGAEKNRNVRTALLSHTDMEHPASNANYQAVMTHVGPKLTAFGEVMLGEALAWLVKEIWINRMEPGGAQAMHNHANSFISGIVYLTPTHPGSATVFYRQVGASTFQMTNENRRCKVGPFNSPKFRAPDVAPGDVVLFPSYLMHEVPPNQGDPRMTAAFNALPERIDSWGYTVQFR